MFAVVQYPFVDYRMLYDAESRSHNFFPQSFPRQTEQRRYFRFLGAEKLRRSSEELPQGEQRFFYSRTMIRFLSVIGEPLPKGVFSRLYADGLSLHYDIGLYGRSVPDWDWRFIQNLMNRPRLRITSRFEPKGRVFSFYTFFNELLRLYQYATTSKKAAAPQSKPVRAGIAPGIPAVILTSQDSPAAVSGMQWRCLQPGLEVGCGQYSLYDHPIAIWYIKHDGFSSKSDEVRRLRICITKIHAYKETVRLLLEFMERDLPNGVNFDILYKELKRLLRLMKKEQYYGFDNRDFWKLAYSIDEPFHGEQWIELSDRVRTALDQLNWKKEELKGMGTVINYHDDHHVENNFRDNHGPLISGSTVESSPINVTNTTGIPNSDVQDFLAEAQRLLEKAAAGKEIEELREQIEAFCASASEQKPNKHICKALFQGIKATMAAIISNADGLEKLFSLGKKIIGSL